MYDEFPAEVDDRFVIAPYLDPAVAQPNHLPVKQLDACVDRRVEQTNAAAERDRDGESARPLSWSLTSFTLSASIYDHYALSFFSLLSC